jgi:hypothetical protein
MHFLTHHRSRWFILLAALLLALTVGVFSLQSARADTKTLEGTWSVQINFTSGQLAGQTKQATVTYASDGTLTSETTDGVSGTGTWSMTSKLGFHYEINEPQYNQSGRQIGYIHVVQDGQLSENAQTNTAQGSGTFYIYTPNGPVPVGVNDANTTAVRTDKK